MDKNVITRIEINKRCITDIELRTLSEVLGWIFLRLEIANPEIWKSEFWYSEITFFVLDHLYISLEILVKALPHLRCVAAFTNIPREIMIWCAQKRIQKVISIPPDS